MGKLICMLDAKETLLTVIENVGKRWVSKAKMLVLSLLVLSSLTGCESSENYTEQLSPIALENGMQVSTCHDYEQARAAFRISETLANQLASAAYLVCSLSIDLSADQNNEETMRAIYHHLAVRKLPTSLSPSTERGVSLSSAGFELWLERSLLVYTDDYTVIQIQYKGKLKNGNHLVWVSDKSTEGNYVAYFPAIIMFEEGKAIGAAPLYASGF